MVWLRLEATYGGRDKHGHHVLLDIRGDVTRDHHWVNGVRGNFPEGLPVGTRVRFFASPHKTRGGIKITDIREVKVIDKC